MTERANRLPTEFAHVLMLDIVGFSQQSINNQAKQIAQLRRTVEASSEYQSALAANELVPLDRGDGMALAFLRDPAAPLQCAIEVALTQMSSPAFGLRMGIHSGPVTRRPDITGKPNVYGDGINTAQRVMDCGDAGHILLSRTTAEVLQLLDEWASHIQDLGERAVKHGQKIALFNYCDGRVGNPTPPQVVSAPPTDTSKQTAPTLAKVALLYKRNAQPDEYVLNLLEKELAARGYGVFVDRHLAVGVEWAQEIERQVREADAVIPLLSEASVKSEMLEFEVQAAHKAAQAQRGRPRLLPVGLGEIAPLPEPLAQILKPLHYALWQSQEDDARLVEEMVKALESPPPLAHEALEAPGGAVPLNSKFYIVRPADHDFNVAMDRRDAIVLVKGARQMGKTSLLARGLQQARESGAQWVSTDFQTLSDASLETPETFYFALCRSLKTQLDLDISIRAAWDEELDPPGNLEWFLRRQVLDRFTGPLVWAMDEVDRLFSCPFGGQVFGLFRSWHNRRATDPTGPWSRLTLAIAYAREAHLFITDPNQSPFNVGTHVRLEDFTREEVAELNRRYGEPLRTAAERDRFYALFSGQPYLVRRGLDEMAGHGASLEALQAMADRDEGPFGDHLRRILVLLARDPHLLAAVRDFLSASAPLSPENFYRLRSAGVVSGTGPADAQPRCRLYATYLSRHLEQG